MKEPRDWTEEYILNNLPVGEFDWLEIKGSQVVKPEAKQVDRELLSKAISAFANSGGGSLVLGLKQSGNLWEVDSGGILAKIGNTTTREWLEDVIPHLVELPLQTFNVYEPRKSSVQSKIDPDKAIFVIEIGDSAVAPHQATDLRYYGRIGGKSKPLGHRFVLDILGRRQNSKIDLEFVINYYPEHKKDRYSVRVKAKNTGHVLAHYVNCIVYIPLNLVPVSCRSDSDKIVKKEDDVNYYVLRFKNISASNTSDQFFPILPGNFHEWEFDLVEDFHSERAFFEGHELIYWEIYADNAPVVSDSFVIRKLEPIWKRGQ